MSYQWSKSVWLQISKMDMLDLQSSSRNFPGLSRLTDYLTLMQTWCIKVLLTASAFNGDTENFSSIYRCCVSINSLNIIIKKVSQLELTRICLQNSNKTNLEICFWTENLQAIKLIFQWKWGAYDISVTALYNDLDKRGLK